MKTSPKSVIAPISLLSTSKKCCKSSINITLKPFTNSTTDKTISSKPPSSPEVSGIYDEDGDLPSVHFITERNGRKRMAESDVSFEKKARIDFHSLIEDIKSFSASSESLTVKKVVPVQLDDFNCNDSDEEPQSEVESVVRVSPIKIKKREIDVEDLKKYLHITFMQY